MIQNAHLDALIAREQYAAMLDDLTPKELAVVALRLENLPFDFTAELLGLTRQGVYYRMRCARDRLQSRFPHVNTLLREPAPGGGDS